MKPDYLELLKKHNEHSFFIDTKGLTNAMSICYERGVSDGHDEVLEWLLKMDYLSDNIEYIIEEWKNKKTKS